MTAVYTPKKCELDIHHIIAHALLNGVVTHADAEGFVPRCTVIRSRIPEIWHDLGWPFKNIQPPNKQAIYRVDREDLAQRAGVPVSFVLQGAKDWLSQGLVFKGVSLFVDFLKGYKPKDIMADRFSWKLYRSEKMVKREEARGELWLW